MPCGKLCWLAGCCYVSIQPPRRGLGRQGGWGAGVRRGAGAGRGAAAVHWRTGRAAAERAASGRLRVGRRPLPRRVHGIRLVCLPVARNVLVQRVVGVGGRHERLDAAGVQGGPSSGGQQERHTPVQPAARCMPLAPACCKHLNNEAAISAAEPVGLWATRSSPWAACPRRGGRSNEPPPAGPT